MERLQKWCVCVGCFLPLLLHAFDTLPYVDLSCDRSTYCKKELACVGHVHVQAPSFKLMGHHLCWQETEQQFCLEGLEDTLAHAEYAPCVVESQSASTLLFSLDAKRIALAYDVARHPTHVEAEQQIDCRYLDTTSSQTIHVQGDRLTVHIQPTSTYLVCLESQGKPCHVEGTAGFKGDAKCFHYDTASLLGMAKELRGELDLKLEKGKGRLQVQADHVSWDGVKGHLTLEGHILLSLYENQETATKPFCTLSADQRLVCACSTEPCFTCDKVQVEGPMQINHTVWGTLTGNGTTIMDCNKNKIIARGLQGSTGEIPLENQVRLETAQGQIQADRFGLDLYREDLHGLSLHAQGQVGIEGIQGQYALAHEMHYDTRTSQGELLGKPTQRVLFWEPRYDVKLSAPSCSFTLRDPETQKIRIQGNGDVRMTFFDMERKKIQTRFPIL